MHVHDALDQVAAIRQQMARTEVFRGYRSLSVGAAGLLGIGGAVLQPRLVPHPGESLDAYLALWFGVAATAAAGVGLGLWRRLRAGGLDLDRAMTLHSVERLLPSLGVGAMLTFGIRVGAPEAGWMLPGLWSFVFSLGVFATAPQLPRAAFLVGVHFAACGLGALLWARGDHAFSPVSMAVAFGGGMLLSAAILYRTLEREDRHGT